MPRGAASLMASDLSDGPRTGLHAQLCGDAHLSNFGLFASPTRLGILGRAAPFPIVNVSRGGGIMGANGRLAALELLKVKKTKVA